MDGIDADVVCAVLHGGRLRQGADRTLGGVVGNVDMMLAGDAGNRGDVDDRAAARRLHDRNREFHAQENAARIDRHQQVQAAVSNRSSTALPLSPASLTRMSSWPNSARAASTVAFHSVSLVTSRWRKI